MVQKTTVITTLPQPGMGKGLLASALHLSPSGGLSWCPTKELGGCGHGEEGLDLPSQTVASVTRISDGKRNNIINISCTFNNTHQNVPKGYFGFLFYIFHLFFYVLFFTLFCFLYCVTFVSNPLSKLRSGLLSQCNLCKPRLLINSLLVYSALLHGSD